MRSTGSIIPSSIIHQFFCQTLLTKSLSADISTTMAAAAAATAAANLALWLALEIEGWRTPRIARGASTVPSKQRPIAATRSGVWNRMTAAERTAMVTEIANFRTSQGNIDNVRTNNPIPPVPTDFDDRGAARAYLTSLANIGAALAAARQAAVQLRTIRQTHGLSGTTVALLQGFEAAYLAEENRITALTGNFQQAVVAESARRAAAGLPPLASDDGGHAGGGRLPPPPNNVWVSEQAAPQWCCHMRRQITSPTGRRMAIDTRRSSSACRLRETESCWQDHRRE